MSDLREKLFSRVNFRNGTFLLITALFFVQFINLIVFGIYVFPDPENGILQYQRFYQSLLLNSDWAAWIYKPWSLLTYSFVEAKFLVLLADAFWILLWGIQVELLSHRMRSLSIFLIAILAAGIGAMSCGDMITSNIWVYGPRIGLMALSSYVWFHPQKTSIRLFNASFPFYVISILFLVLSLYETFEMKSWVLLSAYMITFVIGVAFAQGSKAFEYCAKVIEQNWAK